MGDTTEHGFVFRVDLALRPHGKSGRLALSLSALEDYLQVHGREWERFAWLKSRIVAPLDCIASPGAGAARVWCCPLFSPLLDYNVFDALRALHHQIRNHAVQRSAVPARARQRRQALARRHPRDRVHRATVAGGARRPVSRAAPPPTLEALNAWRAPA